jgi:hypothetical protein
MSYAVWSWNGLGIDVSTVCSVNRRLLIGTSPNISFPDSMEGQLMLKTSLSLVSAVIASRDLTLVLMIR